MRFEYVDQLVQPRLPPLVLALLERSQEVGVLQGEFAQCLRQITRNRWLRARDQEGDDGFSDPLGG
ncbi:hypothetical protein [Streptomyces sp. NPDC048496]|uniref:hypothetical protein n=1 Tax=Streptomyces sp. NPDC048496 TaxID=3365558 RepID=UPI00372167A0